MKVFSNYGIRPDNVRSYNNGVLLVQKAGYRPAYLEIASMIASGERFEQARQFDYPNESDIDKRVNHVDMSNKDKFEMIDEARNIRLELARKIEADRLAKVEADREATRKKIIEEYEMNKASEASKVQTSEA